MEKINAILAKLPADAAEIVTAFYPAEQLETISKTLDADPAKAQAQFVQTVSNTTPEIGAMGVLVRVTLAALLK